MITFKEYISLSERSRSNNVYKISRQEADFFRDNKAENLIIRISDVDDNGTNGWYMKADNDAMKKVTNYDSGDKKLRYNDKVMDKVLQINKRPELELILTTVDGRPKYSVKQ